MVPGDIDFADAAGRLHTEAFGQVFNSPWYADAVYDRFSDAEYQRRFAATQEKMQRLGLDVLIACGGPNHWSWGSGMRWLSNHWEWHGMSAYAVVPPEGEPVLVCGPGGAHREAVRRATPLEDVRHSRWGKSGEVIADLIKEWGLDTGTIGISFVDPVYEHYLPVNEYERLRAGLPGANLERVGDFFHELVHRKSPEEIECVRTAGRLMDQAFHAMVAAARPGVTEYQLAAAATNAVLEGGGQMDFNIIGSTPMEKPGMVFGNPWPSGRRLQEGDIIINELACGYNGYTVQIGSPICIGEPPAWIRAFFADVTEGYDLMVEKLKGGNTWNDVMVESRFFREKGYDSRPLYLHCIDFISHPPHVMWDRVTFDDGDQVLEPGVVAMLEPTIITPDGRLGIFFGRTYVITDGGHEQVTMFPHELIVI
ncbi:MAG TPA: Xaa-Pro peptidase family protein [Acidimicrobiia bacterium]|nr:Xaa-Pro peptidase family protein [Acidimicrobiia bacterium]